jgi:GT2 family glycosyltransferase
MISPRVSIIILNWNGLNDTKLCIKSLRQINYDNYNIIVIDNGSNNNEADILAEQFGTNITLIRNPINVGFSEGCNIGLRLALTSGADYGMLLNNDTEVEADFLQELVLTANTHPKIGMVAPRMLRATDRQSIDNLGLTLTRSGIPFNRQRPSQRLFCPTGVALYSRALLETVRDGDNYFDPEYFAYAEDFDLGWRAILAGYLPAYSEKSVIYHRGSASSIAMSDFHVFHTQRNVLWTWMKNMTFRYFAKYSLWIIAGQLSIMGLYLFRRRPGILSRANFQAVKGWRRMYQKRRRIRTATVISQAELESHLEPTFVSWEQAPKILRR